MGCGSESLSEKVPKTKPGTENEFTVTRGGAEQSSSTVLIFLIDHGNFDEV